MLLKALNLDDDYLLESVPPDRRHWTCSILLFILLTNRTIKHMLIKLTTAELYISAFATLCALVQDIDIRKERQTDKTFAEHYNLLRKEQRRWEEDPRRKEPWEPQHQRNLDAYVTSNNLDQDSLEAAISDWFAVGLYTGIRKSEWAQPDDTHWHPHTFLTEDRFSPLPRAFILPDISFLTKRKSPVSVNSILQLHEDDALLLIGQLVIRWRTQKNGHRNQQIRFTPNTKSPDLCCVRRMIRILQRHKRLASSNPNTPLSIYRHSDGTIRNITTRNIEQVMRHTIARWAQLDPTNPHHQKILRDWASHSLRVGATNALYAAKFSGHQIQIILRWDSLAFMDYFRNLAIIGDQQNTAISATVEEDEIVMFNLF